MQLAAAGGDVNILTSREYARRPRNTHVFFFFRMHNSKFPRIDRSGVATAAVAAAAAGLGSAPSPCFAVISVARNPCPISYPTCFCLSNSFKVDLKVVDFPNFDFDHHLIDHRTVDRW